MNRSRLPLRQPRVLAASSALAAALLLASCGGASASGDGADHAHQHGGPLGHRFEDADSWAARWEGPDRDAWQKPEAVVELMKIEPGMTVVDLGTGTGYFVPHLSRAVGADGRVLALDIEESMVEHVAERARQAGLANVTARKVAYDDPGLEPGSVDRVLCVNTWHHIPGRVDYARKLYAGLAEGGSFFLVDFKPEGDHGPPPESRIAPEAAAAELSAAGFDAKIVPSSLTEQYVVQGTR